VEATGLSPWEGKRAHILAVEPQDAQGAVVVPIRIAHTIRNGALDETCESAVNRSSGHPGMLFLIDVDGDGRCSKTDVFGEENRYAWGSPGKSGYERFQFEGQFLRSVAQGGTYWADDVCTLFGPKLEPLPSQAESVSDSLPAARVSLGSALLRLTEVE